MEEQIKKAVSEIISKADTFMKRCQNNNRFVIGISGRPGSGKTTIASRLCHLINQHYSTKSNREIQLEEGSSQATSHGHRTASASDGIAIVISLDGWHYPRSTLDQFEDPVEAHRKRGAPQTFDSKGYKVFLEAAFFSADCTLTAPSFSHSIKDPIPNSILIEPHHRIIILEGLYTLLEDGPDWKRASGLIHLGILIAVDAQRAKARLIDRHVLSGICSNHQEAAQRVDDNDHPNGEYLLAHSKRPDIIIQSVEDPNLTTQPEP